MAIGQRICFFRNRKGMTQKQFGEILGFLGKTSDVRMAQYESETRIPKAELVKEMAGILGVKLCLRLDKSVTTPGSTLYNMLKSWQKQSAKLQVGEITREEYDEW